MKKFLFIAVLVLCCQVIHAQQKQATFTLLFYNLENLFDTIDDPAKNDQDFLPGSTVAWNTERYKRKIDHLAKAMIASDSVNFPAIIGVAEAENKQVLLDLIRMSPLKKKKYDVVLEEGPDPRGIDVGLIYRKDLFRLVKEKAYRGADSFDGRYILFVQLMKGSDTLNCFVNHWKSRQGGTSETAAMREESAFKLKHLTDSILSKRPSARIVIMGDFNDEPTDKSIQADLKALSPEQKITNRSLYDLLYGPLSSGEGTLYYKDWDIFDQIIVSGNMLQGKGKGFKVASKEAFIVKKPWMLYQNKQGVMVPNRTASSKEYFGGYSDHLPVYIILTQGK